MASNTFGRLFRFTSFGESHGSGVGVVVDGCPGGMPLTPEDIQPWLDRRRPGADSYVTARREPDVVRILSGIHEGLTTGAPIALFMENIDHRPADYRALAGLFRPGHADWTWRRKYGHRDPRGGGRSSARETAARVAAGAVARRLLDAVVGPARLTIVAGVTRIGPAAADPSAWDDAEIERNPFHTPDAGAVESMRRHLDAVCAAGSSSGGVVEVRVRGAPPGWGEPLYDRLDARLAAACMGVNAVKGVEIGDGFASALLRGEEHNDFPLPVETPGADPRFATNHAGGVLGGISTGQELVIRCAVKPTPSVTVEQPALDAEGRMTALRVGGRHDPCVAIRAAPVLAAMTACVLADFALLARSSSLTAR